MRILSIILIAIMLAGCASAASQGALRRAQKNYLKGDYTDTVAIADRALRSYDYTDEQKAELLFLKGSSYQKLDDIDAALATMKYVVDKYPDTEHGYRAAQALSTANSN